MKNAFYFIAGVLFITLISATTVSIMTVKPAIPIKTVAVSGWNTTELNENMKPYLKAGYIVKNVSAGDSARIVIMEKY